MDRYYYFVAQLPLLSVGKVPEIGMTDFLTEAKKWLTEDDMNAISNLDINNPEILPEDNKIVKKYKLFEKSLRDDILKYREAGRLKQDYKTTLFSVSLIKDVDPLQAELNLANIRLTYIENLEFGHFFDIQYIVLYYLKLQLLSRLKLFNKEQGLEIFKQFTEIGV